MPYSIVITKNGVRGEITAVPEGWVIESYLYWPRSSNKVIEQLRADPASTPDINKWKKIKCGVKLRNIMSLEEALKLEEQYAHLDTEDEEPFLKQLQLQRNTPNETVDTNNPHSAILDVNNMFDEIDNTSISQTTDNLADNPSKTNISLEENCLNSNDNVSRNTINPSENQELISLPANELLSILKENASLQTENKSLKNELSNSIEFQTETKRNFAIMQTQLDKVFELLQNKNAAISSVSFKANEISVGNIKFPIETKDQLDELENKLFENDVMAFLVKKFSLTFGISGNTKISKVGLPLIKSLIQDKLLNQFTWKGIKGSSKFAFQQYLKVRELFYRVAHLADKSCTSSDSDAFIQHSAIKHSGQRLKRQSSYDQKRPDTTNKKMRKDDMDSTEYINISTLHSTGLPTEERPSSVEIPDKENICENKEMDNLQQNQPLSCVTILSDIKIQNKKTVDNNDKNKIANISSTTLDTVFNDLIDFS